MLRPCIVKVSVLGYFPLYNNNINISNKYIKYCIFFKLQTLEI